MGSLVPPGAECTYLAKALFRSADHGERWFRLSRFRGCALHLIPPTGMKSSHERSRVPQESIMSTTTLLIIVLVLLVLGGGGYYGHGRWF